MTKFCQAVNLPDPLINRAHLNVNNLEHWTVPVTDLSTEFHDTLSSLGVYTIRAQIFRRPANTFMTIHIDGYEYSTDGKLNFIYNGEKSVMRWYEVINYVRATGNTNSESGARPFLWFDIKNCNLLYEKELTTPHLVEVGLPHNVVSTNSEKDRYCLSLLIADKTHRLSFPELVECFDAYKN